VPGWQLGRADSSVNPARLAGLLPFGGHRAQPRTVPSPWNLTGITSHRTVHRPRGQITRSVAKALE